jgi:hypothetical protein
MLDVTKQNHFMGFEMQGIPAILGFIYSELIF